MTERERRSGRGRAGLRLTEEQLRLAEETAGIGAFELDLASGRWTTTPHVAVLFGLDPLLAKPSLPEWEQAIFADDRLKLRGAIARAGQEGAFSTEFRVTHPDGSVHWLSAKGDAARGSGGDFRWVRGTCLDITERKVLEVRLLALREALEARVRERAQELETSYARLRESERRFRLLVEGVTDYAIFMLDPEGNVVNWNPGAERLKGYTSAEILGQHLSRFYTEEDRESGLPSRLMARAIASGTAESEGWRVRKDGSRFWANGVIQAIRDSDGQLLGFAKVTRDLTERRAAEEQLRQAQKMEAVGQLTGGLAHDFNNLLTGIAGSLELMKTRIAQGRIGDLDRYITAAQGAVARAAALTQRLLIFARRQTLDAKQISPNKLITDMEELVRRTVGPGIRVETALASDPWLTLCDPNQLENAVLNLCINARDAMPDGGRLTIETVNTELDARGGRERDMQPGQYVVICVTDTGTGMPPEVVARAFEPFFTTKPIGQGTGLGLSMIYGFVKQSGGQVRINSEMGAGTAVRIYLPRHQGEAEEEVVEAKLAQAPRAKIGETVLIVDDEPTIRMLITEVLGELGYAVIEAADGASGLNVLQSDVRIDLLITDIGLPGTVNGRQMADAARQRRPKLRVLFITGYAESATSGTGRRDTGLHVLTKPFPMEVLASRINTILAES